MNGVDVPLRPRKPAEHYEDGIPSPRSAVRQLARGLWLVVLCFAVLALSSPSPRIFQPIPSDTPAISSSPAEFVAITRTAALYDLGRSPGAYVWRSEKQKHRVPWHADGGAVLSAIPFRIEGRRFGPEGRQAPAIAALRPFRAFDAQAPPFDC
jgi:hypothetical protein